MDFVIVNDIDQYLHWDYAWRQMPYYYATHYIACSSALDASRWSKKLTITVRNSSGFSKSFFRGQQLK